LGDSGRTSTSATPARVPVNVLLVDDDRDLAESLVASLRTRGFVATWKSTADEALEALEQKDWQVLLTDVNMTGMSGLSLCERAAANRPDLPVVIMTAFGTLEVAIAAIRVGAYDLVTKPFNIEVLVLALSRAVERRTLQKELTRLRQAVERVPGMDGMIGASPASEHLFSVIDRVAESDATVVVSGPSGTGKELIACAVHRRSKRAAGPFVAINCAAIPESLLESELFGHVKGAFTDARSARKGLFARADQGTVFLDEIGDLPLAMQPKLLRVLQERCVRPVGGDEDQPFDARVIAATNRDLEAEVKQGRFREDLYYRLNVVRIEVPPLRARGNDVLLIAQYFLTRFAARLHKQVIGLSTPVAEKLLAYRWPGNVRELENCIERAVALCAFDALTVDDLPEKIRNYQGDQLKVPSSEGGGELLSMEEVERRHILHVLRAVGGNKVAAAGVLGFDRSTLYRKLEHFGLSVSLAGAKD
jgi:two-component system response regulator AtoC